MITSVLGSLLGAIALLLAGLLLVALIGRHPGVQERGVPVIDPAIGGPPPAPEGNDDNTTVFPADSLLVAYDHSFQVNNFGGGDNVRPALAGSYPYVNPVVAVLLGAWLANEHFSGRELVAMGVILSGVVVITLARAGAKRAVGKPAAGTAA